MNSLRQIMVYGVCSALLSGAALASAQPPPGSGPKHPHGPPGAKGPHAAPQEERREAVEARKEAAEERREAVEARKEAREEAREARDARRDAMKERIDMRRKGPHPRAVVPPSRVQARQEFIRTQQEKWKKDREERLKAHRAKIKERWGDVTKHQRVQAELRLHAWRMARLEAIKKIAEEEKQPNVVTRADALMAKETARHERRMEVLKKNPDAPETAEAGSAAPATGTTPTDATKTSEAATP